MSDLISYQMQYIQEFTSAIRKAKRIMREAEHDMRHTSDVQAQKFADLIEQQQQRIVELERKLRLEEELHHVTESGYTELFATIEQQQQQIAELEATVDTLHSALRHLAHNAKASGAEMGLALVVADEALQSTPQQNLAEHDANLIDKITSMIVGCREMELSQGDKDTILLIAQRVKDGE